LEKYPFFFAFLTLYLFIPIVSAHTITVPPNVYFGIPAYGTYINFSTQQTFDTIYRENSYWYFNGYGFQVQNANMTITNFLTNEKLAFAVTALSDTTSTTKVYCSDKGKPISVSGATSWNYDLATRICTIAVDHSSSQQVVLDWRAKIPCDVNGDGVVDASDLFDLSKAYGCEPEDVNWNSDCDFNCDSKVDTSDLLDLGKSYGKTV